MSTLQPSVMPFLSNKSGKPMQDGIRHPSISKQKRHCSYNMDNETYSNENNHNSEPKMKRGGIIKGLKVKNDKFRIKGNEPGKHNQWIVPQNDLSVNQFMYSTSTNQIQLNRNKISGNKCKTGALTENSGTTVINCDSKGDIKQVHRANKTLMPIENEQNYFNDSRRRKRKHEKVISEMADVSGVLEKKQRNFIQNYTIPKKNTKISCESRREIEKKTENDIFKESEDNHVNDAHSSDHKSHDRPIKKYIINVDEECENAHGTSISKEKHNENIRTGYTQCLNNCINELVKFILCKSTTKRESSAFKNKLKSPVLHNSQPSQPVNIPKYCGIVHNGSISSSVVKSYNKVFGEEEHYVCLKMGDILLLSLSALNDLISIIQHVNKLSCEILKDEEWKRSVIHYNSMKKKYRMQFQNLFTTIYKKIFSNKQIDQNFKHYQGDFLLMWFIKVYSRVMFLAPESFIYSINYVKTHLIRVLLPETGDIFPNAMKVLNISAEDFEHKYNLVFPILKLCLAEKGISNPVKNY